MARLAGLTCGAATEQVLVMSTGVIGHFLPMEHVARGIAAAAQQLQTDENAFLAAARGITTTDRSHKVASRRLSLGGREARITGMAKGAGMIGPNMATLLAVILTDARLEPATAQQAVTAAVNRSFNCISVEGHTSTNDTVLLIATGAAQTEALDGPDFVQFQTALDEVCIELARMIPDDGEGASHLITIDVRGCGSQDQASCIAKTVANSALVKAAVAGADPNWGRIVSAAGYAGVPFDPQEVTLRLNGVPIFERGGPLPFDAASLSRSMREQRETHVELQFQQGDAHVRFWTSDLTVDYVRFNSQYTT